MKRTLSIWVWKQGMLLKDISRPFKIKYRMLLPKLLCVVPFECTSTITILILRNIGEFGAKKYRTDHQTSNIIQLFVAVNGNFSGLFFFWASRSSSWLEVNYQNPITSFWRVTFSTYGSVIYPDSHFWNHELLNLVFLLSVWANSLVDSFPFNNMSCLWSLIWLNPV